MATRWVVCADGTWDEPEQTDEGMPCPSNVVRLAKAVAPLGLDDIPQVVCYHSGVGERGGLLDHINGGAFGDGISLNIRDLYLFLVLNYRPGDELFLFGFSRGAYTARSLAGFIRNCGILKDEYAEKYAEAYDLYRDRSDQTHPEAALSVQFRANYAWPDFNIRFIGVWDTVGALGIPTPFQMDKSQYEFHDVALSSHVDYAYQALAIDERRRPFVPCVWVKQDHAPASQVLEQAWFAGVHCNVGGGYEDSGLSDCAFDWMWQRAAKVGLNLEAQQRPTPNPLGAMRDSMTLGYRLLGLNIRVLGAKLPVSNETVSASARERQEDLDYQPQNLLDFERATFRTELLHGGRMFDTPEFHQRLVFTANQVMRERGVESYDGEIVDRMQSYAADNEGYLMEAENRKPLVERRGLDDAIDSAKMLLNTSATYARRVDRRRVTMIDFEKAYEAHFCHVWPFCR